MMEPREMPDLAARRGMLPRTYSASLGARKPLRRIRTPTRYAGEHCTTSGLTLVDPRAVAVRTLAFLRLAHRFRSPSWPLSNRAIRPLPRRHRVPRLPSHRQLRQLRRYGLLPHPGRIRYQGNAQRRIPDHEESGTVAAATPQCDARWNALSSTRWQKLLRLCRLIICAFGDKF
jgi:hypothetical protein